MSDHEPVLLNEVLQVFAPVSLKVFFEGTVGAGGHAEQILRAHPEIRRYLACDRDPKAQRIAQKRLTPWKDQIDWIHGPFADVERYVKERHLESIDGFFIDVGVSSMQLDEPERGFSFTKEAPLDMRMDSEQDLTAETIVNTYSEKELADLIYKYGEEGRSRKVAAAIVQARRRKKITSTKQLSEIVSPVATRGRLHPATLVFQALRIAVNDELGQLERGLKAAIGLLKEGGRLAVISFHSLEDRIVKHCLKEEPSIELIEKKPILPSREEIRSNRRARSAKLRAGIKRRKNDEI